MRTETTEERIASLELLVKSYGELVDKWRERYLRLKGELGERDLLEVPDSSSATDRAFSPPATND